MASSPKKILIYRLGSLGDTIIALPVFHKIHDTFGDAEISLLTNHPVNGKAAALESILGSNYFFQKIINYPVGTRNPVVLYKLIKQIRSLNIDVLIYLAGTGKAKTLRANKIAVLRDKLFFKAAGVKKIIGLPKVNEDFELSIDQLTGNFEWEAKRLARRFETLGTINTEEEQCWDLNLTTAELDNADAVLSECLPYKPIIAISTGTKRQANDWEEDNWIELLQQLKSNLKDWQLIIIGANEETERANNCLKIWGKESFNLCGKISPRVSAAVLKRARIFIGHDSGPMHLAACVGTPCVAIFSGRDLHGQWYPRGNHNKIIYHKTDCAGCGLEVCIEQKKKCILSISVNEVQNAVLELIKL